MLTKTILAGCGGRAVARHATIRRGLATDASSKDKSNDLLPLSGVRVLELGQLIAGPFAGQLLGHFGAEVIKIEPPNGGDPLRVWRELDVDGTSPWFRSIGRNKKSVTIDMRKEEGRALVRRLTERSDVVIENFKPGTLEKWGLGPDTLRTANPGLIFTRVSGYGQTGPWSSRPGYASVCEGEAGFRFINGFPDEKTGELSGPPVRPNISLGDSVAGLTAAFGTAMALLARRAKQDKGLTEGLTVDVSIMESMLNLMEGIIPEFDRKGVVRSPSGSSVTGIVPTGAYPCAPAPSAAADAQPDYVIIGANADSMYERLMRAMDRLDLIGPEFANNQHRVARRAEIEEAIVTWTRAKTRDEVLRVLDQIGVPAGRVASVRDIVASEQVQERGAVEDVWVPGSAKEGIGGGWTVKMPGVSPRLEGVDANTRWAGPNLGAHNREILCGELGLSVQELNGLVERGIVGAEYGYVARDSRPCLGAAGTRNTKQAFLVVLDDDRAVPGVACTHYLIDRALLSTIDMPWSEKVIRQFQTIPPNPIESDFHGAYNKLLNTLFPPDTDFTVVPRYLKPASSKSSDYVVTFEIFFENKPVFILELQKPADLDCISLRQAADVQIRERLGDLVGRCPIPTLHAVSAMGTRLCFYHVDTTDVTADIIPLDDIPRHPTRVNDTAPMERWDCDVLDAEGEARLGAVVDSIKAACVSCDRAT